MIKRLILFVSLWFNYNSNAQSFNYEWTRTFSNLQNAIALGITTDVNGNVYTCGVFLDTFDADPGPGVYPLTSTGWGDMFVSCLDGSGNFKWAKSFEGDKNSERAVSITVDSIGNIFIAGEIQDDVDLDPGPGVFTVTAENRGSVIIKLNQNGDFVWGKVISHPQSEVLAKKVASDHNGMPIIIGEFNNINVDFDPGAGIHTMSPTVGKIFLLKLDAKGDFVWCINSPGDFNYSYYSCPLAVSPSNEILITALFQKQVVFGQGNNTYTVNSTGGTDFYISKFSSQGVFLWAKQLGSSSSIDNGRNVACDESGDIYCSGTFAGTLDFDPGPLNYTISADQNANNFLLKLNSSGDFIWVSKFAGDYFVGAQDLKVTKSGNPVMLIVSYISPDLDPGVGTYTVANKGNSDIYLTELDPGGNFIFGVGVGSLNEDMAVSLSIDLHENIYVVGTFGGPCDFDPSVNVDYQVPTGESDIFIQKFGKADNIETATHEFGTSELKIFPMPIMSELNVVVREPGCYKLTFRDQLMRTVLESQFEGSSAAFDLTTLTTGFYFLEIADKNKSPQVTKVVKY